jgi:predicted secreted hydrolase
MMHLVIFLALPGLFFLDSALSPRAAFSAGWKEAREQRNWSFPRDHGAHLDYRTEWWYFTGNLRSNKDDRYGYQLTFFRQGIRKELKKGQNPWGITDIYFAHFALSDIRGQKFRFAERISRTGPGLAGASTDGMHVWCLDWSARMENREIFLSASQGGGMALDLRLVPRKPLVFHGKKGLSRKGSITGQASYYYSFTDMQTQGSIKTPEMGIPLEVKGTSWFDREFGSNQLSAEQTGWDWFAVHFSDGRDLMLYFLRRKDGALESASSGTLVEKNGHFRHLTLADMDLEVLDRWVSPASKGRYPDQWRITIPSAAIDLRLKTIINDQELKTSGSTGIIYYEGVIEGRGTSLGKPVACEGYVEMTGYAGSIGGLF